MTYFRLVLFPTPLASRPTNLFVCLCAYIFAGVKHIKAHLLLFVGVSGYPINQNINYIPISTQQLHNQNSYLRNYIYRL